MPENPFWTRLRRQLNNTVPYLIDAESARSVTFDEVAREEALLDAARALLAWVVARP